MLSNKTIFCAIGRIIEFFLSIYYEKYILKHNFAPNDKDYG